MIEKLSLAKLIQEANEIREIEEQEKAEKNRKDRELANSIYERDVRYYAEELSRNEYLKNLILEAVIKKEKQISISAEYNPYAKAAAIKLLCPEVSTSVEEREMDMGELNYVTSYSIQVWW